MDRLNERLAAEESSSLHEMAIMGNAITNISRMFMFLSIVFILLNRFYWLIASLYSSHRACTSARSSAVGIVPVGTR